MDKGAKVNKAVKCETCGITLNSEQQAKQHYSGKNHLKKLRGIGKKKEGKDGEDSDKESEHRKFRDRKNRKRDKVINGDGSKTSERDESSSEVKDDKDSQSEGEKLDVAVDKQENTDSSNDKTIIEHQSDELDNVNNCVESPDNCEMQKESEAISSCQSGDLVQLEGLNAECKNSIPNLSQNQDGESMDSVRDSGVNDVVPRAYDGAGFAASNCDKVTNKVGSVPRSPPNGVVVSSCQFTPTSSLDSSAVPNSTNSNTSSCTSSSSNSSSSSSSRSSCNNKSFKLPNGAVCKPVITECTNQVDDVKRDGTISPLSSTLASTTTTTTTAAATVAATTTVTSSSSSQASPSLKRAHSPTRSPSVQSSGGRSATSGLPPKKQRGSSYASSARALATNVEVRASLISAAHLGLSANGIPSFAALQPPLHQHHQQLSPADPVSPTGSQMALFRPLLPTAHGGTSLAPSPTPTYGAQYGSVKSYPSAGGGGGGGGLAPSAAVGSYPIRYQTLAAPSDVSGLHAIGQSVPQALLGPYYPTALTTPPAIQQPLMTAAAAAAAAEPLALSAADLVAANREVYGADLSSYLQSSNELLGQSAVAAIAVDYAGSVSTSAGLTGHGYRYQPLSMAAYDSRPQATIYQPASGALFTSSSSSATYPSSFSGPKNVSAIPTIPIASAVNPTTTTPMMTSTSSDGQRAVTFGQGHHPNDSSKLDPVSQAVYDNVLGKLPLKRKKEIPCTTCGLVFNSDAQASAHFAGSKHQKRQKATEEGAEQVEAKAKRSGADGDDRKDAVRIPCDVCGLVFSNEEQAELHFRGVKHNKRLRLEQAKKEGLPSGVAVKDWGTPFSCTLCNTTLNSAEQLEQHLQGKQHRQRQAQHAGLSGAASPPGETTSTAWTEVSGREPGWFYCQTCDISVRTGVCLQRHVQSQKHKDKTAAKQQA